MSQSELEYLRRREQQHRDRSAATGDPSARQLHQRFADGYSSRAAALAANLEPTG
jgi:hypothetical protein